GIGARPGQCDTPVAVAVDEASGDFYVLDEANGRVERFNVKGEYVGEFDGSGRFEEKGKVIEGGKPPSGHFLAPKDLAIDNTCLRLKLAGSECEARDPSNGDVYVADAGSFEHEAI